MPATAAAATLALQQTRVSLPDWKPATLLDIGAGTGSMAWAAAITLPSVTAITLLEQSAEAIRLGSSILGSATEPALRSATWHRWQLPREGAPNLPGSLPAADLATACYVLGELTQAQQAVLVTLAAEAAPAVVLVEPGTPAGHRRILAAREQLLAAGYLLAAPCPHELRCPLAATGDWCHFGARLPRSGMHRQVKGADLGYEDEKFSYVAAIRAYRAGGGVPPPNRPAGRIVRRPHQRKGLVTLELCERDGSARTELIGKSAAETYRRARKAPWGGRWDGSATLPPAAGREDEEL
jgi:ribosomal protein RSM22 (predicted rRNA methylase)